MRRTGIIAVIALMLVALVGTSVSARPAPVLSASAGIGVQGGTMLVKAKVLRAVPGSTFSATVVAVGSAPVSLPMKREGNSFVARLRVPIAADQALGPLSVSVVIMYNGVAQTITSTGRVVAPGPDDVP